MKIAVAGGYGVGMTMRVDVAPEAGETVTGSNLEIGHGGKGSNQAVAARRLGADVALFTALGSDDYAQTARHFWLSEGVNVESVATLTYATMAGFILVEPSGENRIAIAPGALAALTPGHAESFRATIASADLLIVSLEIPLSVAGALLRIARVEGTRTLLNPAPATDIPHELWPLVDIVTPNQTEAATLLGEPAHSVAPEQLAARLHELTQATVVLTAGEDGVAVHDGVCDFVSEALTAPQLRDTTGAGDAFTAALGVALCESMPLNDAVRFAAGAGALAVATDGVIPALPTRSELDNFLNQLTEQKRETS